MPKCYICDTNMDEVRIDPRDLKPRPCSVCEEEIKIILDDYEEDAAYNYVESAINEFDEEVRGEDREVVHSGYDESSSD